MHDQLHTILWQMPGFYELKDSQSRILVANETATKLLGFDSLDAIIGVQDQNSPCEDIAKNAHKFVEEDKLVYNTGKNLNILYFFKLYDDKFYALLATKKLTFLANNEKAVSCVGNFMSQTILSQITNNFDKISCTFLDTKQVSANFYYLNQNIYDKTQLTQIQLTCLFYLLRGKTAREIALLIKRSVRTVETHLDNIKNKFGCINKSELIEKAIFLGYRHVLPIDFII